MELGEDALNLEDTVVEGLDVPGADMKRAP